MGGGVYSNFPPTPDVLDTRQRCLRGIEFKFIAMENRSKTSTISVAWSLLWGPVLMRPYLIMLLLGYRLYLGQN